MIREGVEENKHLLNEEVYKFIKENNIYKKEWFIC